MAILLFPGRHLLNTRFQEMYLSRHLRVPLEKLPIHWGAGGPRCPGGEVIDEIIFAITSANQAHSRYNPIPVEVRAVGVDRFSRPLREALSVRCRIIPIPHYGPTERFAEFLIKEVEEATERDLDLKPENTLVLSSTPGVIDHFTALGYGVLTGELQDGKYIATTPIEVLKRVVATAGTAPAQAEWFEDPAVREAISPATLSVWRDFPDVIRRVIRLHRDPLLTEQGSLTEMRNYSTYAAGMGDRAILELKYQDIRQAIHPGRIADEGCADGALLVPIARDFPDSDLMGIEITGEFMARCRERQRAMEYGGTYIHFHQRNITEAIFEPGSIDTTICNSTTHELWSYGKQAATVRAYLREKYRQTRKGGRIIIRDVVGPDDRLQEVSLWCNPDDGNNQVIRADDPVKGPELQQSLETQSTAARFHSFTSWYLADQVRSGHRPASDQLAFRRQTVAGRDYAILPLHQAMEFLLKKDYTDNWRSEMNEQFCFWSFEDWKRELREAGFAVVVNPNLPAAGSRAYSSSWIVRNRFQGKVELHQFRDGILQKIDFPVTNMVLVGEK